MGLASSVASRSAVLCLGTGYLPKSLGPPVGFGHCEKWPSAQGALRHHRVRQTQGLALELVGPAATHPSLSPTTLPSAGTGRALGTHISSQEEKPQPSPPPSCD